MAHTRQRHLSTLLKKAMGFWPVVGVLGPRQSGKSTLLRDLLGLGKYVTFDDDDAYQDASNAPKMFLQKLPTPLILDEAQKVPKIFDSVKLMVDRERRPGSYILSGSSQFSSRIGIRESLTGRIGIHYLYPLTLAEAHKVAFDSKRVMPNHKLPARFSVESLIKTFNSGTMPLPLFMRSDEHIRSYYENWFETTVFRDALRVYGRGFNPDEAISVLRQMANVLKEGDYATLKHFKQSSRKLRKYLDVFEEIFLVRRIPPHEASVGSDIWTFFDTGVLSYLCEGVIGQELQLSLARIATTNEILAACEYSGNRLRPSYYKTARGAPIDFIWKDSLIKISNLKTSNVEYDLRPLRAAMTKLKISNGILLWGYDKVDHEHIKKGTSIKLAPWTIYS